MMESFDQAGVDARKDLAALNQDAQTFMAEKGMLFNTPPDTSSFRKKLKDVGFYAVATRNCTWNASAVSEYSVPSGDRPPEDTVRIAWSVMYSH